MERARADGQKDVAALLRAVADGIEDGEIHVGDHRIRCSDELAAVVEVPDRGEVQLVLVSLHLDGERQPIRPLPVEKELAHPGG